MSQHKYDIFLTYHVSSLSCYMKDIHNTFNSTHRVTIV